MKGQRKGERRMVQSSFLTDMPASAAAFSAISLC